MTVTEQAPVLAAYGHSWVAGQEASRPERSFVSVAAHSLGVRVCNLAVAGSATPATEVKVLGQAIPVARFYLLMAGANDARLNGVDQCAVEAYGRSLDRILTRFHRTAQGAHVLVVEQPYLIDYSGYPPHDSGSDAAVDLYNDMLRRRAAAHRAVTYVRVRDWDPATMLAEDAVHPNDHGHEHLARCVVEAARDMETEDHQSNREENQS